MAKMQQTSHFSTCSRPSPGVTWDRAFPRLPEAGVRLVGEQFRCGRLNGENLNRKTLSGFTKSEWLYGVVRMERTPLPSRMRGRGNPGSTDISFRHTTSTENRCTVISGEP